MNDDADYAPALDMPVEQDAAGEAAPAGNDPVQIDAPPDSSNEPRAPRVVSDKVRAMFRDLSTKVRSGEVSIEADELVPVEHASNGAPPAAAPAQPAAAAPQAQRAPQAEAPQEQPRPLVPLTASPAAIAAAALQAPPPQRAPEAQPAQPAVDERRMRELEEREKRIAEREAALEARAKQLPTRERLLDAPVPTLAEYIKAEYGITDDAELKDTITDLMTEMSQTYHGVNLPDEVKARIDGRKAVRKVKAYTSELDRKAAEVAKREAEASKAALEQRQKSEAEATARQAVAQIKSLVSATPTSFPFLNDQGEHGAAIVWEVLKARHDAGESTRWEEAAKLVDDHLRSEADAYVKRAARFQQLLAPSAPAAPAKPAASPGGAPGPAPKQPAPAATTPTPTAAPSQVDPADDIVGEDRRERRSRSLRAIVAKHGQRGPSPA